MDGQPDAELRKQDDQMDCEREPAGMSGDEWKSWKRGQVRRNTLHLVSAAAQWILLLACLVYLGLDSLQLPTPHSDKVPWTFIRYTGESIKGVAMNFSAELGSIHTQNGSVMITCDGPYLVSLRAKLSSDLDDNSSLKLMMRKTENKNDEPFWEQTIQGSSSTVDLVTILYLFSGANITLWTSLNVTVMELSFSLVLLKPDFCNL